MKRSAASCLLSDVASESDSEAPVTASVGAGDDGGDCAAAAACEMRDDAGSTQVVGRPGPSTFEETLSWCNDGLTELKHRLPGFGVSFKQCFSHLEKTTKEPRTLALSTTFSGICTAEQALAIFAEESKQHGLTIDVILWGATEKDELCRSILLANDGPDSPRHVFGDMLDILPIVALRRLQEAQKRALKLFRKNKTLRNAEKLKSAGARFLAEAVSILEDEKIDRTSLQAYCHRHDKACHVCPPEYLDGKQIWWMEVVGLICLSWSTLGNQLHWLDPQALPSLVYLWKLRCLPIHICIMECTPRLDVTWITEYVITHHVEHLVFSTTQLGLPVHRSRVYVKAHLKGLTFSRVPFDVASYGQCFFKDLVADAGIYFHADTRDIAVVHNEMAALRRIPPPSDGSQYPCRQVLGLGSLERLEAFESLWRQHRLQLEDSAAAVSFYAPLSQNATWEKKPHFAIPTLTRNSLIFGERQRRCLLPREHLGVQGMPAYMYDHSHWQLSSCKWLLGSGNRKHLRALQDSACCQPVLDQPISSGAMRSIAGNMMNMQQVGSVMLWVLATVAPTPPQDLD